MTGDGDSSSNGSNSRSSTSSSKGTGVRQRQGLVFDAPDGPSVPGVGHSHDHQQQQQFQQRERRPLCAKSDDPEYSCLVRRPPGSFEDEIAVYFSVSEAVVAAKAGDGNNQQQSLSVKIVVPAAGSRQVKRGHDGGETGWASLGFSPNGKMAGPSEGVVGFVGTAAVEDGVQGVRTLFTSGDREMSFYFLVHIRLSGGVVFVNNGSRVLAVPVYFAARACLSSLGFFF